MAVTETQVIKHLFYTSINCKWCTSGPNRSFDHVSLYFWKKNHLLLFSFLQSEYLTNFLLMQYHS